jgi:hypothetical protein
MVQNKFDGAAFVTFARRHVCGSHRTPWPYFGRKIMIEVRIYCRQLPHFGVPRTVVKIQLEGWAEALLRKREQRLQESSCIEPVHASETLLAKVENILRDVATRT